MQKKLIAAAVAGLVAVPALAQTNVTISGVARVSVDTNWFNGNGVAAITGEDRSTRISDQSSRFILSGTEDLGGGLKAWFQIDNTYNNDIGSGVVGGGNTGVGLSGNWGKLTLGRWDVHYQELEGGTGGASRAGTLQTFVGHGLMSQVNGASIANATRTANLIMWDSPNWNGFTARLAYSSAYATTTQDGANNNNNGDAGGGNAWTGALRYANGPWKAGLSYWNADGEDRRAGFYTVPANTVNSGNGVVALGTAARNTKDNQHSTRLWVSYQFAMGLGLGLGWDRSSRQNGMIGGLSSTGVALASTSANTTRSAWMIPVTYEMGPHKFYFTYARAGAASGSAIAAGTGGTYKASLYRLMYDYALSKRTSVGVSYMAINNSSRAAYTFFAGHGALAAGQDPRQIAVSMSHSF